MVSEKQRECPRDRNTVIQVEEPRHDRAGIERRDGKDLGLRNLITRSAY